MRAIRLMRTASFADSIDVGVDLPVLRICGMHPLFMPVIDGDRVHYELIVYPHMCEGKSRKTHAPGSIKVTVSITVEDFIDGIAKCRIGGRFEDTADGAVESIPDRYAEDDPYGEDITNDIRRAINSVERILRFYLGTPTIED